MNPELDYAVRISDRIVKQIWRARAAMHIFTHPNGKQYGLHQADKDAIELLLSEREYLV